MCEEGGLFALDDHDTGTIYMCICVCMMGCRTLDLSRRGLTCDRLSLELSKHNSTIVQ